MHSSGLSCGKWPSVAPVGGGGSSTTPSTTVFSSSSFSMGNTDPGSIVWLPAQTPDYGAPDLMPHVGKNLRITSRAEIYPSGYVGSYKWFFGLLDNGVVRQSYSIWETANYQSIFTLGINAYLTPADPYVFLFDGRLVVDTHVIGEAPVSADLNSLSFLPPSYTNRVDNSLSSFSVSNDLEFRIGLYTPIGTTPSQFGVRNTVIEVFS